MQIIYDLNLFLLYKILNSVLTILFNLDVGIQNKFREAAIFLLTTFGDTTDIEKIALTSEGTSADELSEPTVILNKNFPKVRVPVRIKSQAQGDSIEVNGVKNSASKLSRTLLQGLFKPQIFLENNADQMIKLHPDIIQASTCKSFFLLFDIYLIIYYK